MNKRRAWQKAQFGLMCSNSIGKAYARRDALGAATEGLAAGAKKCGRNAQGLHQFVHIETSDALRGQGRRLSRRPQPRAEPGSRPASMLPDRAARQVAA